MPNKQIGYLILAGITLGAVIWMGSTRGRVVSVDEAQEFIGMHKNVAIARANLKRLNWRIVQEDDKKYEYNTKFDSHRVDFVIKDGIVTDAKIG